MLMLQKICGGYYRYDSFCYIHTYDAHLKIKIHPWSLKTYGCKKMLSGKKVPNDVLVDKYVLSKRVRLGMGIVQLYFCNLQLIKTAMEGLVANKKAKAVVLQASQEDVAQGFC